MSEMAAPTSEDRQAAVPENPFADWPLNKAYVGKAVPRKGGGWEVRIFVPDFEAPDFEANGKARLVGMTECATLKELEQKTWDFVHAFTDEKDVCIMSAPDLPEDIMKRVVGAWKAMKEAKEAEARAAKGTREAVKELRGLGLSVTDIAFLTHISRGRVSQLLL